MTSQFKVCIVLLVCLILAACAAPPTAVPTLVPTVPPPTATPAPPTATLVPTVAPTYSPTEMARLNPSPRGYFALAYHAKANQVILFGGQTGNYRDPASYNNETWALDVAANKWTLLKPISSPGKRSAAEMAYNSKADRLVLYGGVDSNATTIVWGMPDTWVFDLTANTWQEVAKGPADHVGGRLVYNSKADRFILFGGYSMKTRKFQNDTWAYDLNTDTWTEMKPPASPPGRNYQAMTYDSKADRVLTWGGLDSDTLQPIDESIWAYDYAVNTWQEIKPGAGARPAGRDYPQMVYDAKLDRTILFGGTPGGDETWVYDYSTNTWKKSEPSIVPGSITRHTMVYHTTADRVILFGGQVGITQYNFSREIWAYDPNANTWTNVTPHP